MPDLCPYCKSIIIPSTQGSKRKWCSNRCRYMKDSQDRVIARRKLREKLKCKRKGCNMPLPIVGANGRTSTGFYCCEKCKSVDWYAMFKKVMGVSSRTYRERQKKGKLNVGK